MLYILEGCDGSGKTTLAQKLSKLLDAEIIHCTATTPNDFLFFVEISEAAKDKNIIADRFCYGQFIYQNEEKRRLRNGERDSFEGLARLESRLLENGVKVIFVTAPEEVIEERLRLRGEILINDLTIQEIQTRYAALRKMSILTWLEYNTGGEE